VRALPGGADLPDVRRAGSHPGPQGVRAKRKRPPRLLEARRASSFPPLPCTQGRGAGGEESASQRAPHPPPPSPHYRGGGRVVAAGRLLRLLDRRLDRRLVGGAQLVAVLLQLLLDREDQVVRLVAGVDYLQLLLVLVGVRLGLAAHPLDLLLVQAAGALDLDL